VDTALKQGLKSLNWRSDSIDSYIRDCMELVKDIDLILTTIKDNVKKTQEILRLWEKNLMFDRKEGKLYTFEELSDSFNILIHQRHSEIRDAGKEITKQLSSSNRVLKVSVLPSLPLQSWTLGYLYLGCQCQSGIRHRSPFLAYHVSEYEFVLYLNTVLSFEIDLL
jgi:predicted DNA-binding protein YlxM (UPF0122 family)